MTKAYTAIHQIDRGNLKPSAVKPGEVFAFSGKELKHLLDNSAVRESTDDEINLAKSKNGGKLPTDEAMDVSELDAAQAKLDEAAAQAKLDEADKAAAEKLAAEKIAEAERIAAEKIAADHRLRAVDDAAKSTAKPKKAGKDDDGLDV